MREKVAAATGFLKKNSIYWRVGVVILIFTILLVNIHPSEIARAFASARPLYLVAALGMTVPNLLLQIFKWRYILKTTSPRPAFKTVVLSVLGGFFLGAASPSRSGELARGLLIPGHSTVKIASLTIVDKGFNQVTVILAGLVAVTAHLPFPLNVLPPLAACLLLAAVLSIHRIRPPLERFLHRYLHTTRVDNVLAAFDALSMRTVVGMIGYSLLFYGVYVTQYYVIIRAFVDLPAAVAVKTLPLVYFANILLPVSIGDFGIKEFISVKLLGIYGIAGEYALGASLTNNVMTFLVPSIIGGILVATFNPKHHAATPTSIDHTLPAQETVNRSDVS